MCTTAKLGYFKITTLLVLNLTNIFFKCLKTLASNFECFTWLALKVTGDKSGGNEIAVV